MEETEGLTSRSPLAVQRDWKYYAVSTAASVFFIFKVLYETSVDEEKKC